MVLGLLLAVAAIFGIVHHKNKKDRMRRGCGRAPNQQYQPDMRDEYYGDNKQSREIYSAPPGAPPNYDQRWPTENRISIPITSGDNKIQHRDEVDFDEKRFNKADYKS